MNTFKVGRVDSLAPDYNLPVSRGALQTWGHFACRFTDAPGDQA